MRLVVRTLAALLALAGAALAGGGGKGARTAPITALPASRFQRVFGVPHAPEVKAVLRSVETSPAGRNQVLREFAIARLDTLPLHSVVALATRAEKHTRSVILLGYARENLGVMTVSEVIALARAARGKTPSALDRLRGRDDRTSGVSNVILAEYVDRHARTLSARDVVRIKGNMGPGHRIRMIRRFVSANQDRLTDSDRGELFAGRPAGRLVVPAGR